MRPGGLALALVLASCQAPVATKPSQPTERDPGLAALGAWAALPRLEARRYRQQSSRDPARRSYELVDPTNKDFNNFLASCGEPATALYQEIISDELAREPLCPPGVTGHLIARASGPGFISRIWLTASRPFTPGPGFTDDEMIAIYIDDPSRPAYRGRLADWKRDTGVFRAPLAGWFSGALVSYLPVSFTEELWIVLERLSPDKVYYHQVNLVLEEKESHEVAPTGFADLTSEAAAQLEAAAHAASIQPSSTWRALRPRPGRPALLLDQAGPATLRALQLALPTAHATELRRLWLRATWDGETTIDMPLAAFFGQGARPASFKTLPLAASVDGERLELGCFLPAPFAERARVEVIAEHGASVPAKLLGRVLVVAGTPAGRWGYLHASHNEREVSTGDDPPRHLIAEVTGSGRYVGTMLSMEGKLDPSLLLSHPLAFLEGDELGWIDGELRIPGTGTEDYLNGGFYFDDGPFDHPFAALIAREERGEQGATSAVRWHVLTDAIDFERSFRLELEYGAPHLPHAERYASVAYYYRLERASGSRP